MNLRRNYPGLNAYCCPDCQEGDTHGLHALQLAAGGCREELGEAHNFSKCWEPTEFILWGKMFPPEALGPKCYDHAAEHLNSRMSLQEIEQIAVFDLRPFLK
jgi:hypothetical protein